MSLSENSDNLEESDKADTLEEGENPLDLPRFSSQETIFLPNMTTPEEVNIACSKGNKPTLISNGKYCEELVIA